MQNLDYLFQILKKCDIYVVVLHAIVTADWVIRYNGPGNSEDYTYAIAVDANDNVYVIGYS